MGSIVRIVLAALAAMAIMLFAVACGGNDSSDNGETGEETATVAADGGGEATDELVVTSWGGTFQQDISSSYFQPFAEQEGITVKEDENASLARIKAMVDSGNVQWDVPTVARTDFEVLKEQGLLEPIDYSVFDQENLDNLVKGAADDYGLAMNYYSCGITYRTDLDGHPTSWVEFWDTEKFPGPRAMPKATYAVPPWEPALMADGVKPDDLYPLDFERALDSLSNIADDVTMWYDDTAAAVQALIDGDVDYAMLCNNRVSVAAAEGEPVGVEWNESMLSTDMWVVPKGAPNIVNAMKFLAFTTDPENEAVFIQKQPTGLPNLKTNDMIPPDVVATLPTTPEHLDMQVEIDASFYVSEAEDGKSQLEHGIELWDDWFGSL